jgi:hypothetical protein
VRCLSRFASGFLTGGPGSIPDHMGFVVDKVALGRVLPEYFGVFTANSHCIKCSTFVDHSVMDYIVSMLTGVVK